MNFNLTEHGEGNYKYIDLKQWFTENYDNLPESLNNEEITEPNLKHWVITCIDGIDFIANLGAHPQKVAL